MTSVSLVHQVKWPATTPPSMPKVQFLQNLGAKIQFLKVQSLPINRGPFFTQKFSSLRKPLPNFLQPIPSERKEGERVRETRKFLNPSLGVFGFLGGKLKNFPALSRLLPWVIEQGKPRKKVWVLSGNQGASFGCEFQAEKSS